MAKRIHLVSLPAITCTMAPIHGSPVASGRSDPQQRRTILVIIEISQFFDRLPMRLYELLVGHPLRGTALDQVVPLADVKEDRCCSRRSLHPRHRWPSYEFIWPRFVYPRSTSSSCSEQSSDLAEIEGTGGHACATRWGSARAIRRGACIDGLCPSLSLPTRVRAA
jgi:hypothetical protein